MRVFISYRRMDHSYLAGAVYRVLAREYGDDNVFLDVDKVRPGQDFRAAIRDSVRSSDVVLVMIGPQWAPGRLFDVQDPVRLELLTGSELGKLVVPVLHGGSGMPSEAELPLELAFVAYTNALSLSVPLRLLDDEVARIRSCWRRHGSGRGETDEPPVPERFGAAHEVPGGGIPTPGGSIEMVDISGGSVDVLEYWQDYDENPDAIPTRSETVGAYLNIPVPNHDRSVP